jgi:flavin-dependent dehydrogenase
MADQPKVLIIGGAVAGAACAIALRERGIKVTVVEKGTFPRAKVCGCCLGGSGIKQLDRLGVLDQVSNAGVSTNQWVGYFDGRKIQLPIQQGVAISRESLDPILIERAVGLGASVHFQCEGNIKEVSGTSVLAQLASNTNTKAESFDAVVVASGLRSGDASGELPWTEKPHGPFGISFTARLVNEPAGSAEERAVPPGRIVMVCDDDGYVGLVQLADGRVDIAAALQSGGNAASSGKPVDRVWSLLNRGGLKCEFDQVSPLLTTPPLRRTRRAGSGRIIAIGDAAGYVEPFTGEGMTWAMESGIAAGDLIASSLSKNKAADLGNLWDAELGRLLGAKKRTCRVVTSAIRSQAARFAAARALAIFPGLAKPLLSHLAK